MRLIATDLDGTLLRPDSTLSQRSIDALHAARQAGWYVVLASGRPPFMVAEIAQQLHQSVTHGVLANGSVICTLPDAITMRSVRFPMAMVTEVVTTLRAVDPGYGFALATDVGFAHEEGFAQRMPSPQPVPVTADVLASAGNAIEAVKLMAFHQHHTAHQLLDLMPLQLDRDLSVTHMGADCVEIGPAGIDKAAGLSWLCAELGVDPSDVVAFGDEYNDHEMLMWVGRGIAMENAHEITRDLADEVTTTNVDDGVAMALERILADDRVTGSA